MNYEVSYLGTTASGKKDEAGETIKETVAQVFVVRSNQSWEILPAEEYDWIKPFPAKGEGDGRFIFVVDENPSAVTREAVFKLNVGGETHTSVFTVNQKTRGEYVALSRKSFTLGYSASLLKIKLGRNVDVELAAVSDDSGADGAWVTIAEQQPDAKDSIYLSVAESSLPQPRTAEIAIRKVGDVTIADTLKIFQSGTQELYGLPAVWRFKDRQSEEPYKSNWVSKNSMPADEGLGSISFVYVDSDEEKGDDINSNAYRDIGSTGDPIAYGAWMNDYWLYEVPTLVPANTLFNISFTTRVSAKGQKYWILEYLDGEDWKPVGNVLNTSEPGESVDYTTALVTNAYTVVAGSFKVKNLMSSLKVRYRCAAKWNSENVAPTSRNGGTTRMTGKDDAFVKIEVLGTNVGELAEVTMSAQHVALEGAAESEGSFTLTSSEAWALTSTADWLEFTPSKGAANEETTVTVKALTANETGALRKANLVLNAGMSVFNVEVIQGAAGSILEPFVSICEGNYLEVGYEEKTFNYGVQANVEYTVTTDDDWITILPATRALVEVTPLNFTVSKNEGSQERVGKIVITNEEYGLETVLTVTQGIFEPLYCEWLFGAETMDSYVSTFGGRENDPSIKVKDAGDCGMYVASNIAGNGKIKYIQVDKTVIDVSDKTTHYVGSSGHPLVTGVWPGDYWLFEATDGMEYPAGTKLNISFITRISGTGQKYWMLECWDGESWKPASEYEVKTATVGSETVSYNFEPVTTTKNSTVNATWTLVQPCTVMQFRYRCVANYNAKNTVLDAPGGGTCRIAGADGTSPVFRVVRD